MDRTQENDKSLEQIEYLVYQSTQGIHFMFENSEIAKVLSAPSPEPSKVSLANMGRIQEILTRFIEKPSMAEKQRFLETLDTDTYELLIRAYFQLVDNAILANTKIRH